MSQQPTILQLYAGTRPDGEPVYEKVAVQSVSADEAAGVAGDAYQLLHSPGFVRGLARGDVFKLVSRDAGAFQVIRRSGNLAVRVYSKNVLRLDQTCIRNFPAHN